MMPIMLVIVCLRPLLDRYPWFSEVECLCLKSKGDTELGQIAALGSYIEIWETLALFPTGALLIFTSSGFFETLANLIVVQIFASLDDQVAYTLVTNEGFKRAVQLYFKFTGGTRQTEHGEKIDDLTKKLTRTRQTEHGEKIDDLTKKP